MRVKTFYSLSILIPVVALVLSCNSDYSIGKKKGYFRIDFPEKKYQSFDWPGYPYTFEYPVYATVTKDTMFFDDRAGDWWINVDVPRFGGRIHISYKQIGPQNLFDRSNDGQMAYKQHRRITGIEEIPYRPE